MSDPSQIRKEKKAGKPAFITQDSWKRGRVSGNSWRRPRGLHSKMRLKKSGNPKSPSQGYRSPKAMRTLTPAGTRAVVVSSVKGLALAEGKDVIISSTVGNRKKLDIIKAASEKKLAIINLNAEEFVKKIAAAMEERKKKKIAGKQKGDETRKKAEEKTQKEPVQPKAAPVKAAQKKTETAQKNSGNEEQEERKKALRESEKIITKRK